MNPMCILCGPCSHVFGSVFQPIERFDGVAMIRSAQLREKTDLTDHIVVFYFKLTRKVFSGKRFAIYIIILQSDVLPSNEVSSTCDDGVLHTHMGTSANST